MGGELPASSSAALPKTPTLPSTSPPVKAEVRSPEPKSNAPASGSAGAASTATNSPASTSNVRSNQRVQVGLELIAQNKPVEARKVLTAALISPGLSAADAERVRLELGKVNQRLVFSPEVVTGDPFCSSYIVQSGDALAKLPKKLGLQTEYLFLKRINNIDNERRIRVGQKLKTINGTFHAVVDKRAFRMDLYLGDGDESVFVCSLPVGLGEHDATPEGIFKVKTDSKLINPGVGQSAYRRAVRGR